MEEYEVSIDKKAMGGMMAMFGARGGGPAMAQTPPMFEGLPKEGEEVVVELRDVKTKGCFKARAIFSTDPDAFPDKVYFVRAPEGRLPQRWSVKVLEHLEAAEEEREVKPLPSRRLSLGERKGRLLEELLREREEKMKKKGPPSGPPSRPL